MLIMDWDIGLLLTVETALSKLQSSKAMLSISTVLVPRLLGDYPQHSSLEPVPAKTALGISSPIILLSHFYPGQPRR
jgi:hypothetical protein